MSPKLASIDSVGRPSVSVGWALVLAGALLATADLTAAADAAYVLQVRPSICVSYNSDEPCTMTVRARWEGPTSAAICLHELLREPWLQCWQNSSTGSMELPFANTGDVQYQLQDASTTAASSALATAAVKVINRDLRSARKRRRHVWSIL
jgi:Protein of unknown function (DUF3019)